MTLLESLFPLRGARALIADAASDVWAESPERVEAFFAEVEMYLGLEDAASLRAAARSRGETAPTEVYKIEGGVAHVPIKGQLLKSSNWVLDLLGIEYTSSAAARAGIEAARSDPNVKSIILNIDSPGGAVAGTQALADAVFATRGVKPITAHAAGEANSGAYWIGSQADRFTAEPGSMIGSIGAFGSVTDSSRAAENAGIKVHALRTGEHKGVGIQGTAVSDIQLKELQSRVDKFGAQFVSAVARGRGTTPAAIEPFATGKVWLADDALAIGLIDSIESQGSAHKAASKAAGLKEPASTSTPTSEEEEAMENKDIAAQLAAVQSELQTLREDKAKSEAQSQATAKALEENAKLLSEVRAQQKDALVADGLKAGRIVPAQLEAVKKFAATADVADLRAFVDAMPVQTRSSATGVSVVDHRAGSGGLSAEEKAFAEELGVTEADLAKFDGFNALRSDGKLVLVGKKQFDEVQS